MTGLLRPPHPCQPERYTLGHGRDRPPSYPSGTTVRTVNIIMASTTVTVGSTVGLHARPATVIAEAAANYDDEILIALVDADEDDEPADATSSLMIMALGAEHGDQVTVSSDNADAVTEIAGLVEKNLDEE